RNSLIVIDVKSGKKTEIHYDPWSWVGSPVWFSNGSSIALAAAKRGSVLSQLWEVSWPGGNVSPITQGLASYLGVNSTSDPGKIIAIQQEPQSSLWTLRLAGTATPRLVPSVARKFRFVALTNSGKVISQTETGGHPDLWSIDAATGGAALITD